MKPPRRAKSTAKKPSGVRWAPAGAAEPKPGFRFCYANDRERNAEFVDNSVTTSKYTALNFVPLFLFLQFSRMANAYFLLICFLQIIPVISITNGIPTSIFPLSFVLTFDGFFSAREDYRRHQDDAKANSQTTLTMGPDKTFKRTEWRNIRVGDIVKVLRGEAIPADLVFLSAMCDDPEERGMCHVQTAQLDGETNLKLRRAPDGIVAMFRTDADCAAFKGYVECENPTEHFGKFTGKLMRDELDTAGEVLDANNTVLRGCVLRNVDYIYGLVVYTGDETKVRVKQSEVSTKRPSVEKEINKFIVGLVFVQIVFCTFGSGLNMYLTSGLTAWYLRLSSVNGLQFIEHMCTFLLLNASFIPISLYVSMKTVRQFQKLFFEFDNAMVHRDMAQHEASGGKEGDYRLQVRTMDLNDELGQISHIFSDKTGTLTSNYMDFRKLSVNGVSYGLGTTQIGLSRRKRMGEDVSSLERAQELLAKKKREVAHVNFLDGSDSHEGRTLSADLAGASGVEQQQAIHLFMLQLVLNHTIVQETLRDENNVITGTQLSASSPDEEAFVNAAEVFGYKFISRSKDLVTLHVSAGGRGQLVFRVVCMLPYTPMRKMMSLIVENLQPIAGEHRYMLFSKGADSTIFAKLARLQSGAPRDAALSRTDGQLKDWGEDGLRTLVFAYKPLSEAQLNDFLIRFNGVWGDLVERQKKEAKKPNKIDDIMAEMESNLVFQGATANEDKLQEDVPETIALLAEAGIKMYMLTGDKQETAINIGFATQMLSAEYEQLVYSFEAFETSPEVLSELTVEAGSTTSDADFKALTQRKEALIRSIVQRELAKKASSLRLMDTKGLVPMSPMALIMDEQTLDMVFRDQTASRHLLEVSNKCKTVICCRCRPDQKKMMVELVKKNVARAHTLAIGDGANDVDMILEAHVGVGIAGAEGVQAANSSDYAIGRFKFLQRLLLVHGRWNYNRMSILICYMFYKNIAAVLTQYWFELFNFFSGQKFYLEAAAQTYNILFTGLPILLLGVFDKDIDDITAVAFPFLYIDGVNGRRLNPKVLSWWLFSAVWESLVMFFGTYFAMTVADHPVAGDGDSYTVFEFGSVCFTLLVILVNLRVGLAAHFHHWFFQLSLFGSSILWPICAFIFDYFNGNGIRGGIQRVFGSWSFWFLLPVAVSIALLHEMVVIAVRRLYFSEYRDLVKEVMLLGLEPGRTLTLEQKLAVWSSTHIPAKPVVTRKLREWPHEAQREHILKSMSTAGASESEVQANRSKMIAARENQRQSLLAERDEDEKSSQAFVRPHTTLEMPTLQTDRLGFANANGKHRPGSPLSARSVGVDKAGKSARGVNLTAPPTVDPSHPNYFIETLEPNSVVTSPLFVRAPAGRQGVSGADVAVISPVALLGSPLSVPAPAPLAPITKKRPE